jgi:hypothetical protein
MIVEVGRKLGKVNKMMLHGHFPCIGLHELNPHVVTGAALLSPEISLVDLLYSSTFQPMKCEASRAK